MKHHNNRNGHFQQARGQRSEIRKWVWLGFGNGLFWLHPLWGEESLQSAFYVIADPIHTGSAIMT